MDLDQGIVAPVLEFAGEIAQGLKAGDSGHLGIIGDVDVSTDEFEGVEGVELDHGVVTPDVHVMADPLEPVQATEVAQVWISIDDEVDTDVLFLQVSMFHRTHNL